MHWTDRLAIAASVASAGSLSRIESQRQPMESRQLKDKLPAS